MLDEHIPLNQTDERVPVNQTSTKKKTNYIILLVIILIISIYLFSTVPIHNDQITIYSLELVSNKYYVGMTRNFSQRYKQHTLGDGSLWTKRYSPISVLSKEVVNKENAPCLETRRTCELMARYGYQSVRGAEFAEDRNYTKVEVRHIKFACKHHLST